MTDDANHRRWDGQTPGLYEVWYLTWNHPETGQGFWLRYVTDAPLSGPAHAELWFARFDPRRPDKTFGVHRRLPATRVTSSTEPFRLAIADATLGHDQAGGRVAAAGHDVRWELRWQPAAAPARLFPDLAYTLKIGETVVLRPNPRVLVSGTLVIDGETLSFDRAVLGQTHLWGTKHAYNWTWGRCAELDGAPDALLEFLGVRLHRRGITVPPMFMLTLDLDGEHHQLNQFRHVLRNRATWGTGRVAFTARSASVKVEGELTCTPDQMVLAPYLDPDGTQVFCANTEIGDARVTVYKRAGFAWREHRTLEGKGRAHFELGARVRDPAVTREHTLVR